MEEKVILQEAVDFGLVGKKFTVYGLDPNDNTLERATITTAFYLAYLNMNRNSDPHRFHNYSDLKAYLASSFAIIYAFIAMTLQHTKKKLT